MTSLFLSKFKLTANWLTDALFPKKCLGCGKYNTWCCFSCLAELTFSRQLHCPNCSAVTPLGEFCGTCSSEHYLTGVWSAQPYSAPLIRKLIHDLKFEYIPEIAETLGHLMIITLKTFQLPPAWHPTPRDEWQLVPIPLSKSRLHERGFNQAEKLAEVVSTNTKLKLADILERSRHTLQQSKLATELRSVNIQGSFKLKSGISVSNQTFILVDDVYTSGATLEEAARVLKSADAREVWGLTVARG